MFQICTGDGWSDIAREMFPPGGQLDPGVSAFFVSFIVIVDWTLLQVTAYPPPYYPSPSAILALAPIDPFPASQPTFLPQHAHCFVRRFALCDLGMCVGCWV